MSLAPVVFFRLSIPIVFISTTLAACSWFLGVPFASMARRWKPEGADEMLLGCRPSVQDYAVAAGFRGRRQGGVGACSQLPRALPAVPLAHAGRPGLSLPQHLTEAMNHRLRPLQIGPAQSH